MCSSPSALNDREWQQLVPQSTPELQAFEVTDEEMRPITSAGGASDVLGAVSEYFESVLAN